MPISRPVSIRINSFGLRWNGVYCPADAMPSPSDHPHVSILYALDLINKAGDELMMMLTWPWNVFVSVCKMLFVVRLSFSIMLGPLIRNRHNRNNEHHWFTLSMPISDHNEYSSVIFFFCNTVLFAGILISCHSIAGESLCLKYPFIQAKQKRRTLLGRWQKRHHWRQTMRLNRFCVVGGNKQIP